ncbi:MAG: ABC transporter permease [Bacteroidia bacterium]|nr:ABC transporter permease [Bacteroidia bacterium]
MNLGYYLAKQLGSQSSRSISRISVWLAIFSIALGIAVMQIAISIVHGFEREITNKMLGFVSDIRIHSFLPAADEQLKPIQYPDLITALRNQPDIASLTVYAQKPTLLKSKEAMEGIVLKGVSTDWDSTFFHSCLVEGRLPHFSDSVSSKEILISKKLAQRLSLSVGTKARLYFLDEKVRARPVKIVGLYESGMEEFDLMVGIGDLRLIQQLQSWEPSQAEGIELRLTAEARMFREEWVERLNEAIPHHLKAVSITKIHPELFDWLQLQHQNVFLILILMTGVAILNMATAMIILVIERTQAIGILKALGANNQLLRNWFLWQAFFIIVRGILGGNLLSLGLLWLQQTTGFLTLDAESYFVKTVPIAWTWLSFVYINVGVLIVVTTAMLVPIWLVRKVTPVQALRIG